MLDGRTNLESALAAYSAERTGPHRQLLEYGDRLAATLHDRAAYLRTFDRRLHGG